MLNSNSLPTITALENALPALKLWQQKLNPVVAKPRQPRCPYNVSASSITGTTSIHLQWEVVRGADGYLVYASDSGDFSGAQVIGTLTSAVATSYVDNLGTSGRSHYYRVACTAGTVSQPQSVIGQPSAAIKATSGSGTTIYDHASGAGGYSQPTGGRPQPSGGYACFSGSVELQLADGSFQAFDALPTDAPFQILNTTGVHSARLIVHTNYNGVMIDFAGEKLVTLDHLIKSGLKWIPASDVWANAPRVRVENVSVYNLEIVDSTNPTDHHFVLANGIVAHNYKVAPPD